MLNTTPYLHFQGDTEKAMRFYQSVLGGEITILGRYKDMPGGERLSPEDQEKMIHISLVVNDGLTIMATDVLDNMGRDVVRGSNFHVQLHTDGEADAGRLLHALARGGTVEAPLHKTSYGPYRGMCIDQYGVPWMVSYNASAGSA